MVRVSRSVRDLAYKVLAIREKTLKEEQKELTVEEYSETKIDKDDLNPPLLFVFGKDINSRLIYVKLKIKENPQKHVLCVSFHYAKDNMIFPYK